MKRATKINNFSDYSLNNFEKNDNILLPNTNNIKLISMDAYSHRIINILQSKYFDIFIKLIYDEFQLKIKEKLQEFYNLKNSANWSIIFQKIFKSPKYIFKTSIYKFEINEMILKYLIFKAKNEVDFLISEAIKYKKTNKFFIDSYVEKMKKIREKIKTKSIFDINKIINANKIKNANINSYNNKKKAIMYLYDQIGVSDELINKNFQAKNAEIIQEINRVRRETAVNLQSKYDTKTKKKYQYVNSKYFDIYKPNSPKKNVTNDILTKNNFENNKNNGNYNNIKNSLNLKQNEIATHKKYRSNITGSNLHLNNNENKKDEEIEEIDKKILALKINNNKINEEIKINDDKNLYTKYIFNDTKNHKNKRYINSAIYKNNYKTNNKYKNISHLTNNYDVLNSFNTVSYLSKEDFYYS